MIIIVPFLWYEGMALYPFILLKRRELASNPSVIRHEQIHLAQQKEMLILPFYVVYLLCYLYNLCRFRNHYEAYKQIPFEREAYKYEAEPEYLHKRRFWAWVR
ncbi:hypothetical protein [Mucilaginibacter auburnensis]|uniref:DUF4157 domain-containing protein n=1 Tax=Mucilaginibacter auburnensis TaxID=1457233 RepID=A0A2H9VMN9_9SPHI|nr:hypothetical protein [Mucilaginibacter auburnensis]PJJ79598.1 hypothetical protein CLV57_2732 [Mucilaginibacter auburnensis]